MPRARDDRSGQYVESYPPAAFLDAIEAENGMASTSEITERVGCSRRLTLLRLEALADEERITRRSVGNSYLWLLPEAES